MEEGWRERKRGTEEQTVRREGRETTEPMKGMEYCELY